MKDLAFYRQLRYEKLSEPVTEADGGRYWVAWVTELPGCKTDGATQLEALMNLEAAFDEYIRACIEAGRHMAEPAKPLTGKVVPVIVRVSVLLRTLSESASPSFPTTDFRAKDEPAPAFDVVEESGTETRMALAH